MTRRSVAQAAVALGAASLVAAAARLPLWSLDMAAPQYPKGLHLYAYGTGMTGDLRELNILNHYIGMPPIEAPALETGLFPIGVGVLAVLCLVAPAHRWLRRLAVFATAITPFVVLADLQWRLYEFGHSLDPHAPIRLKPFTPLVIGTSKMGNFESWSMIATGTLCLIAAAALLIIGGRLSRRFDGARSEMRPLRRASAIAAGVVLFAVSPPAASAGLTTLQSRLNAAAPGSTVIVDGGTHGPIVIRGPLIVVGTNGPVIDGGGVGSVVTIEGDGAVFRGFVVRNSGRQVTEEAAGIKATGTRHRIEANVVHDVYFGIHIGGGGGHIVQDNQITPGQRHGARPGHGISVWHVRDSRIAGNRISDARDGVYLSFAEGVEVSRNGVTRCRYGLHSMSSQNATLLDNTLTANLLGAALMQSDKLVLRGNRIEQHRAGSAAYGILLKDIGDLVASDNVIVANRVGVYAEGVPSRPPSEAVVTGNVIAGNEVGLALQSNASLTIAGNRLADNLADVRPLGRQLSPAMAWSRDGRGNSWSQYRGYDANGDGIGDVPHQVNEAMDALVRRTPLAQAFLYTPAHLALEAAARMFPLYRQQPLLVDQYPLMKPPPSVAQASKPAGTPTPVAQAFRPGHAGPR
jgi:nitrous oxidase accessory protein